MIIVKFDIIEPTLGHSSLSMLLSDSVSIWAPETANFSNA